ncbi:MAG: T9SS type A sorting domain-containing protein [Candidatus Latescibacter sp.]|nr:T9SS type A sorting domain-containing protein [Candidatus Latescibacter sp.]
MKKVCILFTACMFLVSVAYAANFQPTLLKLSAPATLLYQFDGKRLDIPFDVAGTPAGVILCVYTKGKAASVSKIRNGFLGWHYMNLVDTSIYVSKLANYAVGKNNLISWEGKNKDGNLVPAGDYTYYLWSFDNIGQKQRVCSSISIASGSQGTQAHIQEKGPDGKTLTNPLFYDRGGVKKWTIGSDPVNAALLETTAFALGTGYSYGPQIGFQPNNFSFFYIEVLSLTAKLTGVRKMQYVPNGVSQFVMSWGTDGLTSWSNPDPRGQPGCVTDGDLVYTIDQAYYDSAPRSEFIYIDATDGSIIRKMSLIDFWSDLNDLNAKSQMNGGPNGLEMRNGMIFLNCHCSCIKQMINPAAETKDTFFLFSNENGDYILDKNYQPTAGSKWACNDYRPGPYTYHLSADNNLFSVSPSFDEGAVSFGLLGPDGTGIGYLAYAAETAKWKRWSIFSDAGTAFDGIYTDNYASSDSANQGGVWYVAHDSIKGVISNKAVGVEEAAPSAFSVAQNTPNPFNPATTINFTLAKAGKVTVDIYNAAGQKVDTVVNTTMSAGNHSVKWNAVRQSAGVYFYTVRTGDVSRTMKMTLLK